MGDITHSLVRLLANIRPLVSDTLTHGTLQHRFVQALEDFLETSGLLDLEVRPILEERIVRGRSDARIGGLVFEVKLPKPHGPGIDAAVSDVREYIKEHSDRGERVYGIGYDAQSLALLDENGEVVEQGNVDEPTVVLKLESWLANLSGKPVTPEDVVDTVGSNSPVARNLLRVLWDAFVGQKDTVPFVDEAFTVWHQVYGATTNLNRDARRAVARSADSVGLDISEDQEDVQFFLFVLETYLSILLKLLTARVATQKRWIPQGSVSSLLTTQAARRFGELDRVVPELGDLFEYDTFTWFIDAARASKGTERSLDSSIYELSKRVDELDLTGLRQDFLRLVYQRFFDRGTRQALGEFYTKPEVVRETLTAGEFTPGSDSVVADITCGSGTFLISAIRGIIDENKDAADARLVEEIISRVVGIDIHPFAVAMARVNYLLALSDVLDRPTLQKIDGLDVPVYWTDSLARLSKPGESITMSAVSVPVTVGVPGFGEIRLPQPDAVDWDELFAAVRRVIEPYSGEPPVDEVWGRFCEEIGKDVALEFEATLKEFLKEVAQRHGEGRDLRWLPFLKNVLAVEALRGQIDLVVGNPPWVRIHNISSDLREQVRAGYDFCGNEAGWGLGCRVGGLNRGFGSQIDYSLPFIERALQLVRPGGRVAFVVTSKVLNALYGNALRRHLVQNVSVDRLIDYSLYEVPLFEDASNYPLIFAVTKREPDDEDKTEVTVVNGRGSRLDFTIQQQELPLLSTSSHQIKERLESPWALVPDEIQSVFHSLYQDCHLLGRRDEVRPRPGVKTGANAVFLVDSVDATDSADEVIVTTEGGERHRIEKEVVRRLVRGEDVKAWNYRERHAIIWTHDDTTGEPHTSLPKRAEKYFEYHRDRLSSRADYRDTLPVWTIFRVSEDKLGAKVAWPEIAPHLRACVLPEDAQDDEFVGAGAIVPLNKVYFVPTLSDAEAHVLAGILNSTLIRAYVASYAARQRGGYFDHLSWVLGLVPIPRELYGVLNAVGEALDALAEPLSTRMERIGKLSREFHRRGVEETGSDLREELDGAVFEMYGVKKEARQDLLDYWRFITNEDSQIDLGLG